MVTHGSQADEVMKAVGPYLSAHRSAAHKFSPTKAALLVIDLQNYFLQKSSHAYLRDADHIVDNVRRLMSASRGRGVPVVFTRHAHKDSEDPGTMGRWWADLIRDGTKMSQIDERFAPQPLEKVIRKTKYSAFAGTSLERHLRVRGVSQLLITGVMTHLCCESSARDAFMKGFDVFFVVDGTASSDRDLHISSIKTLTDGFAIPVTTKEVLRWLGD